MGSGAQEKIDEQHYSRFGGEVCLGVKYFNNQHSKDECEEKRMSNTAMIEKVFIRNSEPEANHISVRQDGTGYSDYPELNACMLYREGPSNRNCGNAMSKSGSHFNGTSWQEGKTEG